MYKNNFVVAIKHKGKILREVNDIVYLPFRAEYSILLKNMSSVKAVATVEVDGVDVIDNNSIIINANDTVELKGFMKGTTVRNKFRFIEKTKKISDYRGDRVEDGFIRVEYRFEKQIKWPVSYPIMPKLNVYGEYHSNLCKQGSLRDDVVYSCSTINDKGITVKGSEVKQDFIVGNTNTLEENSFVIAIQLKGRKKSSGKFVKKPVTVKTKLVCVTCGTKSKSSAKFCRECGTFLE